ncbi:hypothetical protein JR316_0008616 [Psilocybe cubensis]|uniref:Uncharacterized protein n=1 Tax=Psilocybe cubensis TaxID=181762 RepID=A0ACB8GRA8_PSICU|nr:hypothetical protein JR316_0008616 [Psilocybe cubensis]KAH9478163.1 hypothetical protein JR316_0008616 [Psilocybe cubensis]
MSRRYQTRQSPVPFSNEKLFRSAWFSYIRLMDFGQDMICSICGPTPDATIWDGVTVAYSRRNLLPSLTPPTMQGKRSIQRSNGPQLSTLSNQIFSEGTVEYDRNKKLVERITKIPDLVEKLSEINISLGRLFNTHFGLAVVLKNPLDSKASALRFIPSLYQVVKHEIKTGKLSADVLGVCEWLYLRSKVVFDLLRVHEMSQAPPLDKYIPQDEWLKTGCCYAMPAIRDRSYYPNLPYENGLDLGGADIDEDICHKYYSTYSKKRLTGGIMCVWCTHSVCYGFHCIRAAEGRNDVFSAIYTRWRKAPKVVVYDFACALQPYCMSREPEFFKDTLFAIDIFHSSEHKCGEACFLSTYCADNPELLKLNSSAAECGNSGIAKIRKAVSYMTQERAVMYMRVFFSIWNRQQIQKMEGRL